MAVPTTQGEVGIITLNRAQSEGIYPLGLISHPKKADGNILNPFRFLDHDIIHTFVQTGFAFEQYSTGHRLRHKKMQALMENLPTEKRKQAELIYFVSTHESLSDFLLSPQSRGEITQSLSLRFYRALSDKVFSEQMAGLGKEYFDIKVGDERIQYIKDHIIEDFMRKVYDPTF